MGFSQLKLRHIPLFNLIQKSFKALKYIQAQDFNTECKRTKPWSSFGSNTDTECIIASSETYFDQANISKYLFQNKQVSFSPSFCQLNLFSCDDYKSDTLIQIRLQKSKIIGQVFIYFQTLVQNSDVSYNQYPSVVINGQQTADEFFKPSCSGNSFSYYEKTWLINSNNLSVDIIFLKTYSIPSQVILFYLVIQYCPSLCISCDQNNLCKQCTNGYFITEANTCDVCSLPGYYVDQLYCRKCGNLCQTCKNSTSCLSCIQQYYMNENTCSPCDTSCLNCFGSSKNSCSVCANSAYYISVTQLKGTPWNFLIQTFNLDCLTYIHLTHYIIVNRDNIKSKYRDLQQPKKLVISQNTLHKKQKKGDFLRWRLQASSSSQKIQKLEKRRNLKINELTVNQTNYKPIMIKNQSFNCQIQDSKPTNNSITQKLRQEASLKYIQSQDFNTACSYVKSLSKFGQNMECVVASSDTYYDKSNIQTYLYPNKQVDYIGNSCSDNVFSCSNCNSNVPIQIRLQKSQVIGQVFIYFKATIDTMNVLSTEHPDIIVNGSTISTNNYGFYCDIYSTDYQKTLLVNSKSLSVDITFLSKYGLTTQILYFYFAIQYCPSLCLSCDINNLCKQCTNGYFVTESNTCDNNCQLNQGYFVDQFNCRKCGNLCKTCQNSTSCLSCNVKYYLNENICSPCDASCLNCFGPSKNSCTVCSDSTNYISVSNSCVPQCDQNQYIDTTNVSQKQCKQCQQFCKTCSNSTTCDNCIDGYSLDSNKQCQPCNKACLTCNGLLNNNCVTCANQAYFSPSNICVPNCDQNQYVITANGSQKYCKQCQLLCKTCSNSTTCDSCIDGYNLDSYKQYHSQLMF
ncbi:hypothetical protein ABPG73_002892 [Tetrahymena malaccensis]